MKALLDQRILIAQLNLIYFPRRHHRLSLI
nr:MAG TPA: hypothetical protein [Caudoviricetes sp.]